MAKAKTKALATRPGRNGGTLRSGNPGNRGGTGAPPSILREKLRGSFEQRIATLEQIADGAALQKQKIGQQETNVLISADVSDRLKAIDLLAKYGLGAMKEISVENVRERVGATLDVIRQHCPPAQAKTLIDALRPIWA